MTSGESPVTPYKKSSFSMKSDVGVGFLVVTYPLGINGYGATVHNMMSDIYIYIF